MNFILRGRLRQLLVILGWGSSTASLTLATIFQGFLLPRNINGGGLLPEVVNASPLPLVIFYGGNFAICILAAMVISDLSATLAAFPASFVLAWIISFLVLALPDFLGMLPVQGLLQESAIIFLFTAFFPYLLIVNSAGTIIGVAMAERYM